MFLPSARVQGYIDIVEPLRWPSPAGGVSTSNLKIATQVLVSRSWSANIPKPTTGGSGFGSAGAHFPLYFQLHRPNIKPTAVRFLGTVNYGDAIPDANLTGQGTDIYILYSL